MNTSIHKCPACFLAKLIMPVKQITTDSTNLHHWNIEPLIKFSGNRYEASENPFVPLRTTHTEISSASVCDEGGYEKKINFSRAMPPMDINLFFPPG